MQGFGEKRRPVVIIAAGELRSQVLGVGGRPPVAAEEDLAVAAVAADDAVGDRFDQRQGFRIGQHLLTNRDGGGEIPGNGGLGGHGRKGSVVYL